LELPECFAKRGGFDEMTIAESMQRYVTSLGLDGVWSVTHFRNPDVSAYAERAVQSEVRRGVGTMAALLVVLQTLAGLLHAELGAGHESMYVYALIAALGLHVMVATRAHTSLREVHALGITLLVVTSAALVLLAHRTGIVNGAILASVVLLFMVIPVVPWGLKQSLTAMALIYATFTFSTLGVAGRFTSDSLFTMQFLMLASALTAIAIVARNVRLRRDDIEARFCLEQAHGEMHLLSQQDPLTGAWNRRFLEANFDKIVMRSLAEREELHFALLDVDDFKATNDRYGHHHGDAVLRQLVSVLRAHVGDAGYVIRLGGDEFAVLYCEAGLDALLTGALAELRAAQDEAQRLGPIRASAGVVTVGRNTVYELDAVYRRADEALYAQKKGRRAAGGPAGVVRLEESA
jgi:diguanylate cyclase (GGDEF)-like protein